MDSVSTIGLDIAKNVFQVHGIDEKNKVVVRRQLRRGQVLKYFAKLPPCLIGIEACATAHHWARERCGKLGHEVRLMPARYVKAVCQAQQKRCCRRRSHLRGGDATDDAVRADQDGWSSSRC